MVAYTLPDCLPYFEGSDSPCLNTGTVCEPSTVWCDFANTVEAKLTSFDEVIARTATSVPIAWAETRTSVTQAVGGGDILAALDTVRIDTDNMVNLDANASGFLFNTPGLYLIWAWAQATTVTAPGNSIGGLMEFELTPFNTAYGLATLNAVQASWESFVQNSPITANIHMVLPVQEASTSFLRFSVSGVVGDTVTYTQMSVGAAWMAELP